MAAASFTSGFQLAAGMPTEQMRAEVEAAAHWLSSTFIPGGDEADLKSTFDQQLKAHFRPHLLCLP